LPNYSKLAHSCNICRTSVTELSIVVWAGATFLWNESPRSGDMVALADITLTLADTAPEV
jgi:hypothetical protein